MKTLIGVFVNVFFSIIIIITVTPSYAKTLIVDQHDPSSKYQSIQKAIDESSAGDIVFVKNGTYKENINLKTGIILQGESPENTIITNPFETKENVIIRVENLNSVTISDLSIKWEGKSDINACIYSTNSNIIIENNKIYLSFRKIWHLFCIRLN